MATPFRLDEPVFPHSSFFGWKTQAPILSTQGRQDLCPSGENSLQSNKDFRRPQYCFLLPFHSLCHVFIASYHRKVMNKICIIYVCSPGSYFTPRAVGIFWKMHYKGQPSRSWPLGLVGSAHGTVGIKTRMSLHCHSYITDPLELQQPAKHAPMRLLHWSQRNSFFLKFLIVYFL